MPHHSAIDSWETAILTRAIQPNGAKLSATAARAILRIRLDPSDAARLHEFLIKNQNAALTADERGELDGYLYVGLLLDLLQAKARAALARKTRRPA